MSLAYGFLESAARVKSPPSLESEPHVRTAAFYLPQFHPIPINDKNWGKGFTEWSNVVRGKQEFAGHYQPRIPADFGFYDLRLPSVQVEQSDAAAKAGVSAFCYYYYWFDGETPMRMPIDNHMNNPDIKIDFLLSFANENWTRTWDGLESDVILSQSYPEGFEIDFWESICGYLKSPKYMRDPSGKPYLLIHRPNLVPNFECVAETWRRLAQRDGHPGLKLLGNLGFSQKEDAFDGYYEFPPLRGGTLAELEFGPVVPRQHVGYRTEGSKTNTYDYRQMLVRERALSLADANVIPAIMPSWDNCSRRPHKGEAFTHSYPGIFHQWVRLASERALQSDEKLLLINAWNEWAEGAYLEPDKKYGWAFLKAFAEGLCEPEQHKSFDIPVCLFVHVHYSDVWSEIAAIIAQRITSPFYLVLTSSLDVRLDVPETPYLRGVEQHRLENKGRDVLPFLEALKLTKFDFTVGLKLHTKKSLHRVDGDAWRQQLLTSLVAPENGVSAILRLFEADRSLGFVAPEGHWTPLPGLMGSNHRMIAEVSSACGFDISDLDLASARFIAGTMFWFRRSAIALSSDRLSHLFEEENGQLDGTAAHAAERLFALAGEKLGYVTVSTDEVKDHLALWEADYKKFVRERCNLFSDQLVSKEYREKIALAWPQLSSPPSSRLFVAMASAYRAIVPYAVRRQIRILMGRPVG